jgi:enoyl-CoA hydratase
MADFSHPIGWTFMNEPQKEAGLEKEIVHCQIEEGIAIVTIDNPQSLNALNAATLTQLDQRFTDLTQNPDVQGVIITGGGEKSFVAGADISEFSQVNAITAPAFMARGQRIFDKIEAFDRPVIAAINGFALGGGNELAMCCDIRIAAENAIFGQPEVNLAILPGYGGTQRLPRFVGPGKAKEIIFADERISAQEALRIGLIERVVPKGQALEEAKKLMKKIISKGPVAIKMAKKAINQGLKMSLKDGLDLEAECEGVCFATEDKDEGVKAFLGKRPAKFRGR